MAEDSVLKKGEGLLVGGDTANTSFYFIAPFDGVVVKARELHQQRDMRLLAWGLDFISAGDYEAEYFVTKVKYRFGEWVECSEDSKAQRCRIPRELFNKYKSLLDELDELTDQIEELIE